MLTDRRAGVLLHPTSLPGPHGSGDFGPAAYHFVDWLVASGQRVWQVLPLTPTGYGNSPYAGVSAFAGSPLLVALEPLIERGWLSAPSAEDLKDLPAHKVDFECSSALRLRCLREAAQSFFAGASAEDRAAFATYCGANAHWLGDFALFMAVDEAYRQRGGARGPTGTGRSRSACRKRSPRHAASMRRASISGTSCSGASIRNGRR